MKRIALIAAVLLTLPALAETKKTIGVIKSMEAGDVACYVSLVDDRGVAFDELADFDICEQRSLIGKRVQLTYEMADVISDECQGDPECTKTKRVSLITSAKVLAAAGTKPKAASFCTATEAVVFSCSTGTKMVSVCASKDASATRGSLQYRFGKPDAIELKLPAASTIAAKAATGESVPFSGGGGSWLRFKSGTYGYVVYSGVGKWGPNGEPREKQGVVVERGGKIVTSLKCTGKLTSELGPEWFAKTGVTSNEEEFDFPE